MSLHQRLLARLADVEDESCGCIGWPLNLTPEALRAAIEHLGQAVDSGDGTPLMVHADDLLTLIADKLLMRRPDSP